MRTMFTVISCAILFLTACSSTTENPSATQTAFQEAVIAEVTNLAASNTNTPEPSITPTHTSTPTMTLSPTITLTPIPTETRTPRPTSTPDFGSFNSPAPIGMIVIKDTGNNFQPGSEVSMGAEILDVVRGQDADAIARSETGIYGYEKPIEGQEYLAVQIKFELIDADENETFALYPAWQVSLRYERNGDDFWAIDDQLWADTPAKNYPPFSETFWVLFLIREGTQPLLYFQPLLFIVDSNGGETSSGAYFELEMTGD